MNILVLNPGSSSLKFRLLKIDETSEKVLAKGLVEKWGTPQASLKLQIANAPEQLTSIDATHSKHAAEHAIRACLPLGIDALGYRIVHGGWRYTQPTRISSDVIKDIREVSSLAPLHNGLALDAIEAGLRTAPSIPAVAVFDTAFHQTMPAVAATYAIPRYLSDEHHLRRYGFHGISHRYISQQLLKCLNRDPPGTRIITAHLGNGASLCAIRDGVCIDTSMGLTPMEGLIMGTRSGDVDPGLVLHLINRLKIHPLKVDDLLNRRSGLLGLSEISGDLRDVEQAATSGNQQAEVALEIFAYRVRKYIGAYAAALNGLDAIAFSGGIGEHSADMRHRICRSLDVFGLEMDTDANTCNRPPQEPLFIPIHTPTSRVQLWVISTDEELEISRQVRHLLQK